MLKSKGDILNLYKLLYLNGDMALKSPDKYNIEPIQIVVFKSEEPKHLLTKQGY